MGHAPSLLLEPIHVGRARLANRVVSTAHFGFFGFHDPRDDGARYVAYAERRAVGGVGLWITEGLRVLPVASVDGPGPLDFMRARHALLAHTLQGHGTRSVVQLVHVGAQLRSDGDPELAPIWSFGGTTTTDGEATHQMTGAEIERVIDGFVHAARVAVESGHDGVELHGAHGYLIQQSFSPWANTRDDAWGATDSSSRGR